MLIPAFLLVVASLALPGQTLHPSPDTLIVEEAGRPAIQAVRLESDETIDVDGTLDESVWERIDPITRFVQRDPVEGGEPSERTEIRVAYDRDNLFIGAIFYDSEPAGIIAHQRERNAGLGTDDRFMWVIDTFGDGRTGYFFEINPAGLMGDGLLSSSGSINKSWDGIWEVRTARDGNGWSAEIRIPFRTLNFDPHAESWGINFQRTIRRKQEEILWTGHRRNQGLFRPAHGGRLVGLTGISQGVGLEAKPFLTGGIHRAPGRPEITTGPPVDVGLDLTYSLTPSLRAALSLNTDFAEVESDQRRVNLTRFPLAFPERRDFFLEGSSVFSFSPRNGITPFFSRRIGLVGGDPIPIVYGGRMAGQAGAYDLGFFQVRTGSTDLVPSEDFTAARAVRGIFRESSLGAIYTRRGTHAWEEVAGWDAHTVGADLDLFTSSFMGNRNLQLEALFATHTRARGDDTTSVLDRTARGVRFAYPNDPFRWHVSYREFGAVFDPPVGFAPRRAFRRLQPSVGYTFRPHWAAVRTADVQLQHTHLMDLDYRPQSVGTNVPLNLRFESGEDIGIEVSHDFERLERPFRIRPDIEIPTGDYREWRVSAGGSTASRRRISAGAEGSTGGFWSGSRTSAGSFLTVRPVPGVNLTGSAEWNDVRLAEGSFATTLVRLGGGFHPSPHTSLSGTLQYDDVSEIVGLYSRYRWTVRPGSDIFLVYTHNWRNLDDGPLATLERGAISKLTYTHRF